VLVQVAAGIAPCKIVVGGVSQGGALALAALRSQQRLGGVVALGCWLPLVDQPPLVSAANLGTPVLVRHGRHDDMVPLEVAEESVDILRGAGAAVNFRVYGSMGHSLLHGAALEDMGNFLVQVLGKGDLPQGNCRQALSRQLGAIGRVVSEN
jgi:phospholipase/carboxylesterase